MKQENLHLYEQTQSLAICVSNTNTHNPTDTHTQTGRGHFKQDILDTRLFHHYLNNLQMQLSYRLIMPFFIAVSK